MFRTVIALFFFSIPSQLIAQPLEFTIPIFGAGLPGSDATWRSHVLVSNPNDFTVVVTVARILPAITESCDCAGATSLTVPPRDTGAIESIFKDGQRLKLGAVVLSASAPVHIHSWIDRIPYGSGPIATQTVETLTDWLPGGTFVWIPRVFGGLVPESTNLFLINPNPFSISVHYGGLPTADDVEIVLPPQAMVLRRITFEPFLTGAPPQGIRLLLSSGDAFFALTSSGFIIRNPVVALRQ